MILYLLWLLSDCLTAQKIFTTRYTMDNGLSANRIYNIIQDSTGFMWIGTDDGLNRFDGIRFKNYRLSHYVDATTSNSVRKMLIDRRGKMWIGLDNGLLIYHTESDTFEPFRAVTDAGESIDSYITDLLEDRDGEIWIATYGQGIFRYSPHEKTKLKVYRAEGNGNGLPENIVLTICEDSRGQIWFGTYSKGLCRYDKTTGRATVYKNDRTRGSLSDNSIQKIFEDSHGNLWIGTFQHGMDLFDPATGSFHNYNDDTAGKWLYHIHDIAEYAPGKLLIASDNGANFFLTEEKKAVRADDPALKFRFSSNKFIYCLYIDKEESLWLGSYFSGIEFFSAFQNNFGYFSCAAGKQGKVVNSIQEDAEGNYWIGTDDNGIFRFDAKKKKIVPFRTATDIGSTYYCIHDLLPDGQKLYAATFERGLEIFDLKTGAVTSCLHIPGDSTSILSSKVFKLFKAANGRIYIGTANGLCSFDPASHTFTRIGPLKGVVGTLIEDRQGTIWAGSSIDGLQAYDVKTNRATIYRHTGQNRSLTKNRITTLALDNNKRLWVGTYGQGLCLYNEKSDDFTRYNELNLPNQIISSILAKGELLWIATNKGLAAYHPDSGNLKIYARSNGLYNEQFTPGAALEASDGSILLGTADGLCIFQPQNLRENSYNAPLVLTNMSILGKDMQPNSPATPLQQSIVHTQSLTLRHDQTLVGFDFAVLSYVSPLENQYRYMLEGLDPDWQYAKGDNNHISYANLPAGDYRLRVQGTNSDKVAGSNEIALTIRVLPPFFRSPAAYFLYTVVFLAAVFFLIRFYIRHSQEKQKERLQRLNAEKEKELYNSKIEFFTDIAHEIRTPLSLIIGPLDYLTRTTDINDKYGEYLTIIEQNYKRLFTLVNQLLDFRKVDAGAYTLVYRSYPVKNLVKKICLIFELSVKQKNLTIDISGIPDDATLVTDEEAFLKIVSNLLSNAIKYARKTISVAFTETGSIRTLSVTDDGAGIADSEKQKIFEAFYRIKNKENSGKSGIGIGLYMTHALVRLTDGSITVENRNDRRSGTVVAVHWPLRESEPGQVEDAPLPAAHAASEPETAASETEGHYTVMIVDDNSEILDFLVKILAKDYSSIPARNAEEALRILEKGHIDVVVSDVVMEGMNGFEFCQTVKNDMNLSHIPVILLTAKTDTESKVEGLDAGADAYIEKPFAPSHLIAQIKNLLRKKEILQQAFANNPLTEMQTAAHNQLDEAFIGRCKQVILEHIEDSEFSVNVLAQELNMSRTSVFTKIKGIAGLTPNDFIKVIRLKTASKMMLEGKYRITEIGFLVGFSSSSYFAKCFYKQFGLLPTEFIKKMNGKEPPAAG